MRTILCAILSVIFIMWCVPAFAAGEDRESHSTTAKAFSRTKAFVGQLVTTAQNVSQDVWPLVKAADEELARELRSDTSTIRDEIHNQLRSMVPGYRPPPDRSR